MNFGQAISSVFSQYAGFKGRARRSEFWWWALFGVLVNIVTTIIDSAANSAIPGLLVALALLLPNLAVTVRRLHDTDRSGWWILIGLIPLVGAIILIVFACQDSKPDNRFGPSPKYTGGTHASGYPMPGYNG